MGLSTESIKTIYQAACSARSAIAAESLSAEARAYITFMRENRFKDLFSKEEVLYCALEHERAVQRRIGTNLNEYPIPPFVSKNVEACVVRTAKGSQYFVLTPKIAIEDKTELTYLCGGGFMSQPMEMHWKFVCQLAKECCCKIALPMIPLLPDQRYPDAKEYLLDVYQDILQRTAKAPDTLMGDSVGGWAALSLALWARESGLALPARLVLISPMLDLSSSCAEAKCALDAADEMLSPWGLDEVARMWTPDCDSGEARGARNTWPPSPVFANLQALPPIHVFAGDSEILLADALLLADNATSQGIAIDLDIRPGMWHAYPLNIGIPECDQARKKILRILQP